MYSQTLSESDELIVSRGSGSEIRSEIDRVQPSTYQAAQEDFLQEDATALLGAHEAEFS